MRLSYKRHTGCLDFHRGTCASTSRSLCSLSLRCNGHSLLLSSYFSRIGRNENPSCSACGNSSQDTSDLILHCPATDSLCACFLAIFCLCMTSSPGPGELPGFLLLAAVLTTTTEKLKLQTHYYVAEGVSKFRRS